MSEPRPVETLLDQLEELCSCDVEDDPRHKCIFCDAREQIIEDRRVILHLSERIQTVRALTLSVTSSNAETKGNT